MGRKRRAIWHPAHPVFKLFAAVCYPDPGQNRQCEHPPPPQGLLMHQFHLPDTQVRVSSDGKLVQTLILIHSWPSLLVSHIQITSHKFVEEPHWLEGKKKNRVWCFHEDNLHVSRLLNFLQPWDSEFKTAKRFIWGFLIEQRKQNWHSKDLHLMRKLKENYICSQTSALCH